MYDGLSKTTRVDVHRDRGRRLHGHDHTRGTAPAAAPRGSPASRWRPQRRPATRRIWRCSLRTEGAQVTVTWDPEGVATGASVRIQVRGQQSPRPVAKRVRTSVSAPVTRAKNCCRSRRPGAPSTATAEDTLYTVAVTPQNLDADAEPNPVPPDRTTSRRKRPHRPRTSRTPSRPRSRTRAVDHRVLEHRRHHLGQRRRRQPDVRRGDHRWRRGLQQWRGERAVHDGHARRDDVVLLHPARGGDVTVTITPKTEAERHAEHPVSRGRTDRAVRGDRRTRGDRRRRRR